jgi:hypothetical protein
MIIDDTGMFNGHGDHTSNFPFNFDMILFFINFKNI